MTAHGNHSSAAISMEELSALSDEMAALIRAGIPLEQGLAALGGEMPRRPARLVEMLSTRMAQGESLQAILAHDDQFPPVWRAVVNAGLRSGQLAAALESLSRTTRRVAELRKLVGAGLLYPILVVSLAYALLVCILVWLAPRLLWAHVDLTGTSDWLLATMAGLGSAAAWWAIPVPVVAAILLFLWWRRFERALWTGPRRAHHPRRPRWLPRLAGFRQAMDNGRRGAFTETLALLVNHQVPLPESLVLAAEASGDRTIFTAASEIAGRLQRGDVFHRREDLPYGLPSLVAWLVLGNTSQRDVAKVLLRAADVYRDRAARAASWTAVYLPISLTVFLGGGATFLCGLLLFVPLVRMLYHLTWPVG